VLLLLCVCAFYLFSLYFLLHLSIPFSQRIKAKFLLIDNFNQ